MLISRAEAERRRAKEAEDRFKEAMVSINSGITDRFKDDENFAFPVDMDSQTREKVVEALAESEDWNFISYIKGVLTLRSTKRGNVHRRD